EINEKIFLLIRDLLKLMYTSEGEEPSVEEKKSETTESLRTLLDNDFESREEILEKIENPDSIKPITNYESLIKEKELPAGKEQKGQSLENSPKTVLGEKDKTPSILAQKLSGSFQIPMVQTEHTLNNISKDADNSAKSKTGIPNIDPYREIPG
ncbi:MAG: hypothetical protein AAB913_02740, partial [Patescibacteria group bacterium]